MASAREGSTGRSRSSARGGSSLFRRVCSVLTLGATLAGGPTTQGVAQAARGRAAAAGRAGAVSTPRGSAAATRGTRTVSTPRGQTTTVHSGRAVSTPHGSAAAVHHGRAVSTPRGTAYVGHTTVVRAGPRPYAHAPYAYGGRRYYAYNRYAYHRYTPYYWGPAYHPLGFFAATLAATAVVVTVAHQQYRYDQGVWYVPSGGGYQVVPAPVGASVTALPSGSVAVGDNEYYYAGAYYQRTSAGYTVVAPRAGTVVENLPPGGEEVTVGERRYVKIGDTYYQPIETDGQPKYEVVEVK